MVVIDCHAHLTEEQFTNDLSEIMVECCDNDIHVVAVGMYYSDFEKVLEISNSYQNVCYGLGLHPIQKGKSDKRPLVKEDVADLSSWLEKYSHSAVCIGECGLDFSQWLCPTSIERDGQREALLEQIKLSKHYNLPLNLHSRSAGKPLLKMLKENSIQGALLHAFDGGKKAIKLGVEQGHYFSIAPSILRDPSQKLVATTVPFDRLVLESDAPALGPVKGERNTPVNVLQTVDALAELLSCPRERVIETTTQNALRLFPKLKNFIKV